MNRNQDHHYRHGTGRDKPMEFTLKVLVAQEGVELRWLGKMLGGK